MAARNNSIQTEKEAELAKLGEILGGLTTALAVVEDPREARGLRHQLTDVLAIAILASLCGCDSADAYEDWAEKEEAWLGQFLQLKHGTPSQDVFLRVFAAINPETFRIAFMHWAGGVFSVLKLPGQIAVDGQTHRGSRKSNSKPVHMVHALACESGLVVGQVSTDEKSNEITAIPVLLRLLDLRGALVSTDAMGCQVKIAKLICDGGGDYLFGLKENQKSLHEEVVALFSQSQTTSDSDEFALPQFHSFTDVDGGHGRIETRTARVCSLETHRSWVPASQRWPKLNTLIQIHSVREDAISGKASEETRYYVSSRELSPEQAIEATRNHWKVESLHWCLDVSFGQDANQTRTHNAAENLGVVRHFAINIIRAYKGDRFSAPKRRRLCDYKIGYRERLLGMAGNAAF